MTITITITNQKWSQLLSLLSSFASSVLSRTVVNNLFIFLHRRRPRNNIYPSTYTFIHVFLRLFLR